MTGRARRWLSLLGLGLGMCATLNVLASDRVDVALSTTPGDAARGSRIFANRDGGHCVLCHAVPDAAVAGNVGPALAGVGTRLDAGQIRLRIMDITRVNPDAVMPAFHRTQELLRVAREYSQKPVLTAQQVEDLVAYLVTLK